jgi:hypothetical protein
MSVVYFIEIDELKEKTTIDLNVEDKILRNNIMDAQEIDIQSIIGSRLYLSLKDKVIDDTLADNYKTLMDDYITPALIKFSLYRSLDWLYTKIKNSSVVNQNGENSSKADIAIVEKLKSSVRNDTEYYSNKLKQFLEETDIEEYDDYNPDSLSYYTTPDISDSYFCGIYTKGRKWCDREGRICY